MANTPDFSKIFSTNSPSTPFTWTDSDYLTGWHSIAQTPPSRQQFDALQMLSDLKSKYLMEVKAPIESPTFTGDPKAPTPPKGDSDTSIATTAFVRAWVEDLLSKIEEAAGEASESGDGIVASSLGLNGYIKFKNGLIIQWGRPTNTPCTVTWPISFTSEVYICVSNDVQVIPADTSAAFYPVGMYYQMTDKTKGYFWVNTGGNTGIDVGAFCYIAIGR